MTRPVLPVLAAVLASAAAIAAAAAAPPPPVPQTAAARAGDFLASLGATRPSPRAARPWSRPPPP